MTDEEILDRQIELYRERMLDACRRLLIPGNMWDGLCEYVLEGRRTGGFLEACFENNLMQAATRADRLNMDLLFQYAALLYSDTPIDCHGSPERVVAWKASGGLRGWLKNQPRPLQTVWDDEVRGISGHPKDDEGETL